MARVPGTRLRSVTIAFGAASVLALLAIPVYALLSTAEFALRSFWSFGALFPLVRVSAFGRGFGLSALGFRLWAFGRDNATAVESPRAQSREPRAGTRRRLC